MKKISKCFMGLMMILGLAYCIPYSVNAASYSKKVLKTYKSFLEKNVSRFKEEEGDWYTKNTESYKKCTSFMILDMDNNRVPELITYHPIGYKTGNLCIYTYKKGKVVRVKNSKKKNAEINEDATAAGYYATYACNNGHVHVVWQGGWIGQKETIYNIKNGKLNIYLSSNIDNLKEKSTFKMNGKKISELQYYSLIGNCKESNIRKMRSNSKKNRSKYVK